jgi:hypothetical protein
MFRMAICAVALSAGLALGQDTRSDPQHSSSSETHIPSAGVTLDMLQSLPPPYRHWSGGVYQTPQPILTYSVVPVYSYPTTYPMYFRNRFATYGLAGYYPQGAGGRYPSNFGWWLW